MHITKKNKTFMAVLIQKYEFNQCNASKNTKVGVPTDNILVNRSQHLPPDSAGCFSRLILFIQMNVLTQFSKCSNQEPVHVHI